jgi:glycine/D-amino acid oxidase-like deaminating enzyme
MVHQLLEKLISNGLNIQAHTPVSSVSSSSKKDGLWSINTARGTINTAKVVYATNAYTSHLLPEYARAITPVRGVCSHIESPKGKSTPHLVNTYGIRIDKVNNDYLVPRSDGSIIVGGARQTFWHNKHLWFDNTRDDELVDEATSYFSNYMQHHFRGWENSEMATKLIWTGSELVLVTVRCFYLLMLAFIGITVLGYSFDFMPHVGEVPGKPGQFIIAGFTGYGMPKILLSGKGLAAMIRDGASFGETGLPRVFETTKKRNKSKHSPLEDSLAPLWVGKAKI